MLLWNLGPTGQPTPNQLCAQWLHAYMNSAAILAANKLTIIYTQTHTHTHTHTHTQNDQPLRMCQGSIMKSWPDAYDISYISQEIMRVQTALPYRTT